MVVNTLFLLVLSVLAVMVLGIWNRNAQHISRLLKKALTATLSDIEAEIESNGSDDEGILNAFTTTVDPPEGITEVADEEEDLVELKFKNMDEQDGIHTAYAKLYKVSEKHEKLYRLATKKLSDVELDRK